MLFIKLMLICMSKVLVSNTLEDNQRKTRIIGGHRTTITDHPYQVLLYVDRKFECSGSILAEFWVLTAAHCTSEIKDPYNLVLRAGSSNRFRGGILYRVQKIIIHPEYDSIKFNNDFSLIRVKRSFNFRKANIKPIKLATEEPQAKAHLIVSGWGTTGWSSMQDIGDPASFYSTYLMEVDVFMIDRTACARRYEYVNNITESMICANAPDSDACAKDSGGPLVDAKQNILVGIVSWGAGCAYNMFPGIYSNVAYAKPWIEKMTG